MKATKSTNNFIMEFEKFVVTFTKNNEYIQTKELFHTE